MSTMKIDSPIRFDNSFAALEGNFFSRVDPEPAGEPSLVCLNESLAEQLGIDVDWLRSEEGLAVLAGNRVPQGADPLAMVYAGHQFGAWAPRLGDGRAVLLGEIVDKHGVRHDLQLKGAGRTPYARGGDGRAWLGPAIREYVVSEAMHAMGVPTTRALAVVRTGQYVHREKPLPGAIVVRVAQSHIRVGTFQYFLSQRDTDGLHQLARYVVDRHYPQYQNASDNPGKVVLREAVSRQASLVARWQALGFVHGVMNTDNCSIIGHTIDYGPCAFLDIYREKQVFSSIDVYGRYAYQNQPAIAQWNLVQLAQALLPIMHDDPEAAVAEAQQIVDQFSTLFANAWQQSMLAKLGFSEIPEDTAPALALLTDLLQLMADNEADFTQTFSWLRQARRKETPQLEYAAGTQRLLALAEFSNWQKRWQTLVPDDEPSLAVLAAANPVCIPRNHRVEAAINDSLQGDDGKLESLLEAVTDPLTYGEAQRAHALAPALSEVVTQTFCGT